MRLLFAGMLMLSSMAVAIELPLITCDVVVAGRYLSSDRLANFCSAGAGNLHGNRAGAVNLWL
ncbi:MAG: hypothetical protein PHO37_07115 [Kiritimatiellae bacterium]|nr:hypothetical protein [Kiritimatiellia bacterium]